MFFFVSVRKSGFWALVPISVDLRSIAVHLRPVASASDRSHRRNFVRSVAYGSDRAHRDPSVRSIAERWDRSLMGFYPEIGLWSEIDTRSLRSVAGWVFTQRSVVETEIGRTSGIGSRSLGSVAEGFSPWDRSQGAEIGRKFGCWWIFDTWLWKLN